MICRAITYFGKPATVACDAKCSKAWGIVSRPTIGLSADPDDVALLADDELPDAPADPGTYEGGFGKPTTLEGRLNKWCVRACERSVLVDNSTASGGIRDLPTFSRRLANIPGRDCYPSPALRSGGDAE